MDRDLFNWEEIFSLAKSQGLFLEIKTLPPKGNLLVEVCDYHPTAQPGYEYRRLGQFRSKWDLMKFLINNAG